MTPFLCVGAQKSGSTTLYKILKSSPYLCLSNRKELHFFDSNNWIKKDKNFYMSLFNISENHRYFGEITPSYLHMPGVPEMIHNYFRNNIKIIILYREPVSRAYSQWIMNTSRKIESRSFYDAITTDAENSIGHKKLMNFSYVDRGLYYKHSKRFESIFNNILYISINELADIEKLSNKLNIFFEFDLKINNNIRSDNKGFLIRNPLLQTINSNKIAKKTLRFIFSDNTIERLQDKFSTVKPTITSETKTELFDQFFSKDYTAFLNSIK